MENSDNCSECNYFIYKELILLMIVIFIISFVGSILILISPWGIHIL